MATLTDPYRLEGKTALITGASRAAGIGAAVALELAQAGADIFLTYYRPYDAAQPWGSNEDEISRLLAELQASGVRAAGRELDLSRPETPAQLMDLINASFGPVHILINNAAYSTSGNIDNLDADSLDRHYAVNVRGMALLCQAFVHQYPGGEGGRIINLTSGQSVEPMPAELAYATSKGAVEAFTVSLSAELAPRGITVNAVDPGATDTGWMSPELHEAIAENIPVGRVARPEDAARLICFLAGPAGGYITGQVIHSRGGL